MSIDFLHFKATNWALRQFFNLAWYYCAISKITKLLSYIKLQFVMPFHDNAVLSRLVYELCSEQCNWQMINADIKIQSVNMSRPIYLRRLFLFVFPRAASMSFKTNISKPCYSNERLLRAVNPYLPRMRPFILKLALYNCFWRVDLLESTYSLFLASCGVFALRNLATQL